MDRAQLIRTLQDEYTQKRGRRRAEADRRLQEAVTRDPEIGRIRARASTIALAAMRDMMRADGEDQRRAIAVKMRRDGLENNKALRSHLLALGLPEDWLEEKYDCEKCRDTGLTDEIPARFCECFENALRLRMFEDGTMAGLDEQNFSRFDEAMVNRLNSAEDAQRIILAKAYCQIYAEQYPQNQIPGIILAGPGGVGKTFLLNCIFARICERGLSGIRITAYRMHEIMRKKHFGAEDDAESFDSLVDAPLLMIDDLGTEPVLKNITVEYLFTLLNERCAAKRHTVIATNLSMDKIKERYGERVSSRLLDKTRFKRILLKGRDLRQG
jgi:DNA replication protein DnaC